jgi:hypothetical protein
MPLTNTINPNSSPKNAKRGSSLSIKFQFSIAKIQKRKFKTEINLYIPNICENIKALHPESRPIRRHIRNFRSYGSKWWHGSITEEVQEEGEGMTQHEPTEET